MAHVRYILSLPFLRKSGAALQIDRHSSDVSVLEVRPANEFRGYQHMKPGHNAALRTLVLCSPADPICITSWKRFGMTGGDGHRTQ